MELFRALGALAEPPSPEHRAVAEALGVGELPAAADHDDLFTFQLYPYAAVYLGPEGMLGGEARDRVAGFWRALGQTPPAEPDHLSVLLALYARLGELEGGADAPAARERWRHARKALLWEHLASWLPAYLAKLSELGSPFYRRWGELLAVALASEAAALGPPGSLPFHLRAAPPMADPRAGDAEAFLAAQLAPVRSGVILVRSDLDRAARELDLGSRIGERKFVLRALLGQDAPATLRWLAGEAGRWADVHRAAAAPFAPVTEQWAARAERTAALLAELSRSAS
jgi:TorA maturation chaperone TorD